MMNTKKTYCWIPVLLLLIIIIIGKGSGSSAKNSQKSDVDANQKVSTGFGADYTRCIFDKYKFGRYSSIGQIIYYESEMPSIGMSRQIVLAEGTIEKYMHDGSRYIAYHITELETATSEIADDYYAILDTQTENTERFSDIETLSKTIQERQTAFGNWFYTYAVDSVEGVRTPLFDSYSVEYLSSVHGQTILFHDVPLFYGVLDEIQTDGTRYIAFRERITDEKPSPWYHDPITNALLSPLAEKKIGRFRRGFLNWFSVFYDQYVLFDTLNNSVREFDSSRAMEAYFNTVGLTLHDVVITTS